VFVKTFFYLKRKKIFVFVNYFIIFLIPLFGDVELFDGILTRGDDDDGPATNCDGGVPRKEIGSI